MGSRDSMWKCPKCERLFANTNQAHSCIDRSVEELLANVSPAARVLYESLEDAVGLNGPFRRHAVKTRVAFITRMSFAGCTFKKNWIDVGFILPWWVDDARFSKIELFGPTSYAQTIRLSSTDDFDEDLMQWAALAYRRGDQEHFDSETDLPPARTRVTRGCFQCIFAGKVSDARGGEQVVVLPSYLSYALGDHRTELVVRMKGSDSVMRADSTSTGEWSVPVAPFEFANSLACGDRIDVTVKLTPTTSA